MLAVHGLAADDAAMLTTRNEPAATVKLAGVTAMPLGSEPVFTVMVPLNPFCANATTVNFCATPPGVNVTEAGETARENPAVEAAFVAAAAGRPAAFTGATGTANALNSRSVVAHVAAQRKTGSLFMFTRLPPEIRRRCGNCRRNSRSGSLEPSPMTVGVRPVTLAMASCSAECGQGGALFPHFHGLVREWWRRFKGKERPAGRSLLTLVCRLIRG